VEVLRKKDFAATAGDASVAEAFIKTRCVRSE